MWLKRGTPFSIDIEETSITFSALFFYMVTLVFETQSLLRSDDECMGS